MEWVEKGQPVINGQRQRLSDKQLLASQVYQSQWRGNQSLPKFSMKKTRLQISHRRKHDRKEDGESKLLIWNLMYC